jgi:two-component system copper resistance phosphate regulon response regulator CusR
VVVAAEAATDSSLREELEKEDFDVRYSTCAGVLSKSSHPKDIDVMILSWGKPGDGECAIIRKLREKGADIPLIVVFNGGSYEQSMECLDVGADDYLQQPVVIKELAARIRATARRYRPPGAHILRIADLELDGLSREVRRAGELVHLSQTEFKLLAFLIRNKGRVVPKKEIVENVWGINFDTRTNVVDVYISYLRRAVDSGYPVKLIHTVHGEGIILQEQ